MAGIWSPVLVPRIGYCEYRCTLCGQVCPTGAIRKLGSEEKAATKIVLAMIDQGRCLPLAHNMSCLVCDEVCPTSPKAIWWEEVRLRDRSFSNAASKSQMKLRRQGRAAAGVYGNTSRRR